MASTANAPIPPNSICDVCANVSWLLLPSEDLPGHAHHRSLEALISSAQRCVLCGYVLHGAVSNYRRSLKAPGDTYRWRRFETVHTMDDPPNGAIREAAYVKELGLCMPCHEPDLCPNRGGYITPMTMDWDKNLKFGRTVITAVIGMTERNGEEPIEDAPIDLDELRREIPQGYGVWLYSNWWVPHTPDGQLVKENAQFMGVGARFGKTGHMFDSVNNPKRNILIRGSALAACIEDGDISGFIARRPREIDSQSERAFRRLSQWIKDCETKHKCAAPLNDPPLPTRVIDVTVSERSVKLVESKGQKGRYIALSHSWGSSSRLMATKLNVDDLKQGIAVSFLPKTFQDAIKVTKTLGVKYLWIDSLCIVQDDPLDWEKEASTMGDLYLNSWITISAAACTDSLSGCFPSRTASYTSPASLSLGYKTQIQIPGPDTCTLTLGASGPKPLSVHMMKEWLPGSLTASAQVATIGYFGKQFDPVAGEPLSHRGWTLQERLLPARIIHYARDQMYFECDSMLQSEDGFHFDNSHSNLARLLATQRIRGDQHGAQGEGLKFSVNASHAGTRWEGGWIGLVQDYSRRKLTVASDKLPALAGLARIVAERTGERYFAGLWGPHMLEDLFWRVCEHEETFNGLLPIKGKIIGKASKPETYRAPSWSWASVDAPQQFIALAFKDVVARVMTCETTPSGRDVYGAVKDGRIVIEGPVYEVFPHTPKEGEEWKRHGMPVEIRPDPDDEQRVAVGALHLDLPDSDDPFHRPCFALFLDTGNALVLRTQRGRPRIVPGEIPGSALNEELPGDLDTIPTSLDVKREVKTKPETADWVFQAFANTERIGVALFYRAWKPKTDEEKENDLPVDVEKLSLEDLLYTRPGESWAAVTKEDPRVRVIVV